MVEPDGASPGKGMMDITAYPRYLFWNYARDVTELPEEVAIRRVALYGDIEELRRLREDAQPEKLARLAVELRESGRFLKRANFIEKIMLAH